MVSGRRSITFVLSRTIYAATTNSHKLVEFREILADQGVTVHSVSETGRVIPEVVEDGRSFVENAIKKARTIAQTTNEIVFADDSGLEVFALNGEPGIRSARYAGPDATDSDRLKMLLTRLEPFPDRSCRFVCVIAIASPAGLVGTAEGEVRGSIARQARGSNGFGYDPVFIPDGHLQTFAELSSDAKNSMSHRRRALENAIADGSFNSVSESFRA